MDTNTPQLLELAPSQMTGTELAERMRFFARRSRSLCGEINVGGRLVEAGPALAAFFDKMASGVNDPETMRTRAEFLDKVQRGDPAARQQFCALRLETYSNYLYAQMAWIAQYFQVVELVDDDRPMVQNTYGKEIKCYYVGADGRPKSQKVFKDDTEAALPLRQLATPIMRYKVNDIYRGNIVDQAVKTLTLARDMANKMEAEAKALLDTTFGTFTFSGPRANWPYVANSYIQTANLPSTNSVDVAGATGYFDFPVLDEIIDYASRFNGVLAEDGQQEFKPTGLVRVPSSHVRWFGTIAQGSSTPGSYTPAAPLANAAAAAVLEKGWITVNYKGIQWVFVPDATLNPAEKYAYPEFTIKPGRIFRKPSQDREFLKGPDQDARLFAANEEERGMKTVFAAYVNSARRIYAARFDYSA